MSIYALISMRYFFAEFPIILHEWLSILVTRQTNFHRREAFKWSDKLDHKVTSVSNTISIVVDFWVDSILQGYITEFEVDTITSYSEVEINFFQGPRRRDLLSIKNMDKDASL